MLSSKKKNILNILSEYSKNSDLRTKHCACLMRKNKMISIQTNFATYDNKNTMFCSVHAEVALHFKLDKRKLKKQKYDMWVIRFSNSLGIMNSKPCCNCVRFIKKNMSYVDNIYYSNNFGEVVKIKNKDIKSEHLSNGFKYIIKNKN